MSDLDTKMDLARISAIQASKDIVNGGGTPVADTPSFRMFIRMITPSDILAVTNERDTNIIARGLRMIIAGAKNTTQE